MLFEKEPSPLAEKILDSMLVLHADHTMNASTFSARVVGSTLADPYTVVSSAIGTLSGPLHGGANEAVVRMLDEIGPSGNARAYIEKKLKRREKVMGVGHRIYKTTDPRGEVLKRYIGLLAERDEIDRNTIEASREIESVVMEKLAPKGLYPNIDFYSGILFRSMGVPTELFTPIFAMGRVVGWLAHWMEQLNYNRIYRPEQKYTGLRSRPYIPMEERG
jgi:citrate synthase